MDFKLYQRYLKEYLQIALRESDGSNSGIAERLDEFRVGRFSFHRDEKRRALADLRLAFSEHRHWPRELVIRHLGVELDG